MKLVRNYLECPAECKHHTVAIGNFDGVHLGHRKVIDSAKEIAHSSGNGLGVLTFDPHPVSVLRPELSVFMLTEFDQKLELLESLGVDVVYTIHFTKEFASLSADAFIHDILVQGI